MTFSKKAMKSILKNKKIWIFLAIIIVVGIGIFSATRGKNTNKKSSTYTVRKHTIRETLSIAGVIDAQEKVTLRFQTSGMLSWVGVKEGDTVYPYQAIASLDQMELTKTLQKYLNSYESERRDFDQTTDEYRQPAQGYWGLTWDQRRELDRALEKAQYDLNSSVLDVELKSIALKYATLVTPIGGIVTKVTSPFAGINVTPSQAEFEVVNPTTLYLSVLPDQNEVSKITSSMSATIVFDPFPEATVSGAVQSIAFAPKSGESSTVYEVKLSLPTTNSYRIGMTADATFVISERQDVIAIPFSMLKTDNGKPYVFRKIGNTKEKTSVTIGLEGDDFIEITSGLAEGDILYD